MFGARKLIVESGFVKSPRQARYRHQGPYARSSAAPVLVLTLDPTRFRLQTGPWAHWLPWWCHAGPRRVHGRLDAQHRAQCEGPRAAERYPHAYGERARGAVSADGTTEWFLKLNRC